MKEENDGLRRQNAVLQEEKHFIVNGYEDRIRKLQGDDSLRMESERRQRILEQENQKLEEELNKTRLAKMTIESQLDEFRRRVHERDDVDSQVEALLAERNYFENQFKQAKAIQINLEQELRQKADERAKLISDYEIRISSLQNEIVALRSQKDGESMRKSQTLVRLQDENMGLAGEVGNLRSLKNNLEAQIDRLRNERLGMDDSVRLRIAEIEAANRNSIALLDQERRNGESMRILLQQKSEELAAKESEFASALQQKLIEIFDLKSQLAKTEASDINKVLLMIEVERLQAMLAELVQGGRVNAKDGQINIDGGINNTKASWVFHIIFTSEISYYSFRLHRTVIEQEIDLQVMKENIHMSMVVILKKSKNVLDLRYVNLYLYILTYQRLHLTTLLVLTYVLMLELESTRLLKTE